MYVDLINRFYSDSNKIFPFVLGAMAANKDIRLHNYKKQLTELRIYKPTHYKVTWDLCASVAGKVNYWVVFPEESLTKTKICVVRLMWGQYTR